MSKIGVKFVKGGKIHMVESCEEYAVDDCLVVESDRGLELAYVAQLPKECQEDNTLKIVRKSTNEDIHKMEKLKKNIPNVTNITNKLIAKYKLDMKLVDISYTLDGSKVIISYICEDRVDFRELVKDLAFELKLRIELKQIGVRDQAKTLGGIGLCGKECCCKEYLNDFDKVSVKMAKVQGLSLNPAKISGLCGRLMCCLAYENDTYAELSAKMPKLNSRVNTPDGEGQVVYNNLLKQLVSVKVENNGEIKVSEYELKDISPLLQDNSKEKTNNKNTNVKKTIKAEEERAEKSVVKEQNQLKQNADNSKDKHFHKNKKKHNFKKNHNVKK